MKNKIKDLEGVARQAWLAGLGAYSKGWDLLSGKLDETYGEANEMLTDLISNGEKIEADLQDKLKSNQTLDEKIAQLREKLGLDKSAEDEQFAALASKVEALTTAVDKITKQRAAAAKTTTAAKPVPAKKTTATTKASTTATTAKAPAAPKPAAPKPAAKKPAAKPAAKKPAATKPAAKKPTAPRTRKPETPKPAPKTGE